MDMVAKFAHMSEERERFTAWLSVAPAVCHGTFAPLLLEHEMRFLGDRISAEQFSSIVGELCRDLRGVTEAARSQDRSASGHRVRDVIRLVAR